MKTGPGCGSSLWKGRTSRSRCVAKPFPNPVAKASECSRAPTEGWSPNVLDRLIQQAIVQVLTPIFDPGFSDSSFGFRPNRSAHEAAKQVQKIIRQGHAHCVDVDLSKFFDRVQHDVLMHRVSRKVHDRRLLRLIGRYLRAGVMAEGVLQPTEEGAPRAPTGINAGLVGARSRPC